MVGAVVLDRHGNPAAEDFHAAWGGPHAEALALARAGHAARGGTLYVTLEPCVHEGKTPPCTDAVLRSGIARVVVAGHDPTSAAGGGLERLRAAGLEVEVLGGSLGEQEARLNRRWRCWATRGRPWITAKAAVSLDGRIATRTGQSKWITGAAARTRGHELREEHDAILVGVGTVLADDPHLDRKLGLNPVDRWLRVVLDSRLRTPLDAAIVRDRPESTLVVHTAAAPARQRQALATAGVRLLEVDADRRGWVRLEPMLLRLAQEPIAAVLVEGGASVHGAFADAGLIDETAFYIAPMILGGDAPAAVAGAGVAELGQARRLSVESVARCGDDVEIRAVVREGSDVHRTG
jgi:diaminohydroxyphosphoribosylaminopyrimidine deaminase/5-amino-6-(5-phosphoribosylamino)uracil reductase